MKILYTIPFLILIFSCNPKKENNEIVTIYPNEIQVGEIVHDSLTTDQLDKIKIIQTTFQEVYPTTLEETITDFKRDLNPDNEIAIWLSMADAYQNYLNSKNTRLDLPQKKEVFKLILSRSMMPSDKAIEDSDLKILTREEANKVLSFYKDIPKPIKVYRK
jgi:hypothetical protein